MCLGVISQTIAVDIMDTFANDEGAYEEEELTLYDRNACTCAAANELETGDLKSNELSQ